MHMRVVDMDAELSCRELGEAATPSAGNHPLSALSEKGKCNPSMAVRLYEGMQASAQGEAQSKG